MKSCDKPTAIVRGTDSTALGYGPERQLLTRTDVNGGNTTSTVYVGGLYEKLSLPGGQTEERHTVGDTTLITYTDRTAGSAGTVKTRYLHRDHLGSITAITDEAGTEVEAFSFDAWGKRRAPTLAQLEGLLGAWGTLGVYQRGNLTIPALTLSGALTDRGFTGHRQLDGAGLIHLGGRVYDAELGRFLSADPFVRDAADLQALNRYSYVENNPLSYTDPSGYFLKKLVKGIVKAIRTVVSSVVKFERELRRSILRAVGSVEGLSTLVSLALNAIPGCVGWCSAMLQASFSAAMADANGGTISQALKAGAIGFARAGLEQMGGGASPGGGSGNGQLVFQLDAAAKSMGLERGSSLKDLFVSEAVARLRVAERKAQANINKSGAAKMAPQSQQIPCLPGVQCHLPPVDHAERERGPLEVIRILKSRARDMQEKNFIGGDKFYHCLGMCEAASLGAAEAALAVSLGIAREMNQQYRHGDPASESAEDNRANGQGIAAGRRGVNCPQACSNLMPPGMTYP